MSLFKKRRAGNIRERITAFDEEDDDGNEESQIPGLHGSKTTNGSLISKKDKKKVKEEKKPAVNALSFEDELEADDGITFQEKKSTLSYKLRREMKKERKEKKKEEKQKPKDYKKGGIIELAEMGIRIVNGREAEAIAHQPGDSDDEDDYRILTAPSSQTMNDKHQFRSQNAREGKDEGRLIASSRPGRVPDKTLDPLKNMLQSGQIPDANIIHLIRKQRQQARERGDLVPVEDPGREPAPSSQRGRLVREEDTDRDEDDGGGAGDGRLHLSDVHTGGTGGPASLGAVRAAMVAVAVRGTADGFGGSDEEDSGWENQQMMKAAGKLTDLDISAATSNGSGTPSFSFGPVSSTGLSGISTPSLSCGTTAVLPPSVPTTVLAASVLLSSRPGVNYQAEAIMKRLRDSRSSLDEVHRRRTQCRAALAEEHKRCDEEVDACLGAKEGQAATFVLYQALRGYVTDLRECLNEKMVGLEDLESRVLALYKQRTDKLLIRRRQDVADQNDEVSPFLTDSLKQCPVRGRRCAEREGRRTRRRREREKRGGATAEEHHDGTSTDDELTTQECQEYTQRLEALSEQAAGLFSDVEEDFCSLNAVLRQFEKWRRTAPQAYEDAYAANNMPKIVEVFVRMELLLWNPLTSTSIEVERQSWYTRLAMYAAPPPQAPLSLQQLSDDPDKHLLSLTVERVVLHKLRDVVTAYWDPLSHSQTVRLVNLVRHVCETCPSIRPASRPLRGLCQAVIDKIKVAIDKDVFIPIFTKTAYESRTSAGSLFFQRQFWVAWKLLSQVLMWHKVLSEDTLAEYGIKGILNPYLIPALNIASTVSLKDGLQKAKYVIQAMPREWTKRRGDGSARGLLANLENFLASTAQKTSDLSYANDTQGGEALHEIHRLLKSIGATRAAGVVEAKYLPPAQDSDH